MLFFPDCSTVIQSALRHVTSDPRLVVGAPRCSQEHLKVTALVQSTLRFDHPEILVRQLWDNPRCSQWHNYILLMNLTLQFNHQSCCTTFYMFTWSWPPSESATSLIHVIQIHTIIASKWISKLIQSLPPSSHDHRFETYPETSIDHNLEGYI